MMSLSDKVLIKDDFGDVSATQRNLSFDNLSCLICFQQFTMQKNFLRHIRQQHVNILKCGMCGVILARSDTLETHLKTHFGRKLKRELTDVIPHKQSPKVSIQLIDYSPTIHNLHIQMYFF